MCVLDVSDRKIVYYRTAMLVIGVDAQNFSDFSNATGIPPSHRGCGGICNSQTLNVTSCLKAL